MKIRTKTGQIFHVENNPLTQILLDAGLAEIVNEPAKPVVAASWGVGIDAYTDSPYIEAYHPGAGRMRFVGPNAAKQIFYCCGRGEAVPGAIAKQFKALPAQIGERRRKELEDVERRQVEPVDRSR